MKDINVKVSTKVSAIVGGIVILVLSGALGFSYYEMSNMRRDLYGVRSDYYGLNVSQDFSETALTDSTETDDYTPEFEIISQQVKPMRILDNANSYKMGEEEVYKTVDVRVVEVKITNDTDVLYGYYSQSIGVLTDDNKVLRGISVHVDDDMNAFAQDGTGSLELAPEGVGTVYLYLLDDGKEVKELYNLDGGWGV